MLICPACRYADADGLHLQTLDADGTTALVCACSARFAVDEGVAMLAGDAARIDDDVTLAVYLDAHYGDRAQPRPDGPGAGHAMAPLLAKLVERAVDPVEHAVELGCSVGRATAALAAGARHVIGLDLQVPALRRARRILDGQPVTFARRSIGNVHAPATITAYPAVPNVTLICADALDPPLVPGMFDRVVAFNLLDAVPSPRGLLAVLDGLCAPGGELLLASPYAWHDDVTAVQDRLGTDDPADALRALLTAGDGLRARYAIVDDDELSWTLRSDARRATTYACHYLRARKLG